MDLIKQIKEAADKRKTFSDLHVDEQSSLTAMALNIKDKEKLPSVTTILKATESEEKRASLAAWRERMGEETATRIVDESGARGTAMHKILEKYILDQGYVDETNVGKQAHNMAIRVIEQGL